MTTQSVPFDLSAVVRLDSVDFFLDDPYPVYAQMRREAPVLWCPDVNAFAVTRFEDVRAVSRDAELWSSKEGTVINDAKFNRNMGLEVFPADAELLIATDPPRQRDLRKLIAPAFRATRVAEIEPLIRQIVGEIVESIEPGVPVDFVDRVAVPLPLQLILAILGLPQADGHDLRVWADTLPQVAAPVSDEKLSEVSGGLDPLKTYLARRIADRKANPTGKDDLISALIRAELDGEKLSDINVLTFSMLVLSAGNGTTRNLLSSMAFALAHHPDQIRLLRDDASLVSSAVEESLRWRSPVIAHLRTANRDTELNGVPIRAGQHIHLIYESANHDEEIYENPEAFDITRGRSGTHIAFGDGPHVCPGASLARLEARILLEALTRRFSTWEFAGEPVRLASVLHSGFTELPLVFHN